MKVFNNRPIALILIFFVYGIITAFSYCYNTVLFWVFSIGFVSVSTVFIVLSVFRLNTEYFNKRRINTLAAFLAVIAGVCIFFTTAAVSNKKALDHVGHTTITATATDAIYKTPYSIDVYLRDATVLVDGKVKKVSGKIHLIIEITDVYSPDVLSISAGDSVVVNGALISYKLLGANGINASVYKKSLTHFVTVNSNQDITVSNGNASLGESLRLDLYDKLVNSVGDQGGAIAFAMLIGDTTNISNDFYQAYSASGLTHLFAVSGLHIGFLAAAIVWILNKLRLNNKLVFAVTVSLLFAYAALCGFSPSVIRAAVMTTIYMLSQITGKQHDNISSLSLAAIVLLLIKPLYLFDIGFLMSFTTVLGIIMLQPLIKKAFSALPNWLKSSLSVSLAAQIALIPISAKFFGELSVFSVLINIVAIPAATVAFTGLAVAMVLNLMFPLGFLFKGFFLPIDALTRVTMFVQQSQIAKIAITGLGALAVLYYLVIVLSSKYCLLNKKAKAVGTIILTVIFTFVAFGSAYYNNNVYVRESTLTVIKESNSTCAIMTVNGKSFLIINSTDNIQSMYKQLKEKTDKMQISHFDYVVFSDISNKSVTRLEQVMVGYSIGCAVLPFDDNIYSSAIYSSISQHCDIKLINQSGLDLDGLQLEVFSSDSTPAALKIYVQGTKILFANGLTDKQASDLTQTDGFYDIIITTTFVDGLANLNSYYYGYTTNFSKADPSLKSGENQGKSFVLTNGKYQSV